MYVRENKKREQRENKGKTAFLQIKTQHSTLTLLFFFCVPFTRRSCLLSNHSICPALLQLIWCPWQTPIPRTGACSLRTIRASPKPASSIFIHLSGWSEKKGTPANEALRRTRIRLLRATLQTFGAISTLRFDFEHNGAFVTFADAAASAAALEQLSTPERRALALRNAAQALALDPCPLDGASFVLKRAAYLKRSKAHKKAKTLAQFVAAKNGGGSESELHPQ
jgi:hypothetical protein